MALELDKGIVRRGNCFVGCSLIYIRRAAVVRALLSTIVVVLFLGLLAHTVSAEETKCDGAIVKIEGENVTVKDAANERLLKVEPGTRITSGGKPVSVDELKVGRKVKCVCDKRDGQTVCTTMEIMRDTP
jgi:hypothetical protein